MISPRVSVVHGQLAAVINGAAWHGCALLSKYAEAGFEVLLVAALGQDGLPSRSALHCSGSRESG